MDGGFVAVDWGTTNRRVYRIGEDGAVASSVRDDRGILSPAITSFDDEVRSLRAQFPDTPMLLAGMIGSNRGWHEAAYIAAPAGIAQLAENLLWVVPNAVAIVPGVSRLDDDRADVMRGEEVQLLGAVHAGLAPPTALLCQPGTHAKWAEMIDGRIADFTTAMTGELFGLLRAGGILAADLGGDVTDGDAFRAGVARGTRRDLLADLFGARAARLLGRRDAADQAAYVSGVVIGNDVAARLAGRPDGQIVHLLAEGVLADLYAGAIDTLGGVAHPIDSEAAFIAGMAQLWRHIV